MKKILAIIIIIIILGAIGFVVWLFSGEKPVGEKIEMVRNFFPFGGGMDLIVQPPPEDGISNGVFTEDKILTQLTQKAISGATFKEKTLSVDEETLGVEDNEEDKVRYVEKSTGHIYEISPQGGEANRLSNITILKTFESVWSADASKVILRYMEDGGDLPVVQNFSINLVAENIEGIFLSQSIKTISSSPDEEKIFYLAKSGGEIMGITSSFENEKQVEIFSSPFGEFNIDWPAKNTISLLTKPSSNIDGFLYFLNAKTGFFDKVLGDIRGLTALWSPSTEKIIYSQSKSKSFDTFIYDTESEISSSFNLRTLPEKCVWSKESDDIIYCAVPSNFPRADYPDEWYQGIISFSDAIWKVDIANGSTEKIHEIKLDVIELFLSTDEDYLFFINKLDNTLWSLKLE